MRTIWAGLMVAAIVTGGAVRAGAQGSAHFGWAQSVVGTGFTWPMGAAVDANGNVFVADSQANTVSEIVAVNGVIPPNPQILPLGSGFKEPEAVAVDLNGNVFVADTGNSQVKEIIAVNHTIPANPTVISILNYGISIPQGVAVDASGDVFVAQVNGPLLELMATDGSLPQHPSAVEYSRFTFADPTGVAVDRSGNAFVVNSANRTVYEFQAVNGKIPHFAIPQPVGGGLSQPSSVAVDASGDVFVSDLGVSQVEELVAVQGTLPANPVMRSIGEGIAASLGVAVDARGNVYATSPSYGGKVFQLSTVASSFGAEAVGTLSASPISLQFVFDQAGTLGAAPTVDTDGLGALDFTDTGKGSCNTNGTTHQYEAGDTCTVNVAFKPVAPGLRRGSARLTDEFGGTIAEAYMQGYGIGPQTGYLPGTQIIVDANLSSVGGIAVDAAGDVFVSDTVKQIVKLDMPLNGTYSTQGTFGGGWSPVGLAINGAGDFFVADTAGNGIQKETVYTDGYGLTTAVSNLQDPKVITVDGAGKLYIADPANNRVLVEEQQGSAYIQSGVISNVQGAAALAVDASGNVYYIDEAGDVVLQSFDNGLYIHHSVVAQGLGRASGIAADLNGNVFISDTPNNRILEETPTGTGTYTQSVWLSGISAPGALALDRLSNLYIAETGKNRVLKQDYSDMPVLTFAATTQGTVDAAGDQVELVQSMGNERLKFSSVSFPSDFPDAAPSEDCNDGNDIAPGYGCTITVKFHPTAAMGTAPTATLHETVSVVTNSLNGTNVAGGVKATGVELKPVTVSLTTSTTTTTSNVAITATATVSGASGTPTGTVQFNLDGIAKGSAVTLASGKASASITIPVGTHVLTAVYSGSSTYPSQTSAAVTINSKTAASATLSAPATVVTGKPLAVKATVSESLAGIVPTGSVQFYVIPPGSTTAVLEATLPLNSSGAATWSSNAGAPGTYKGYAVYSGDENYTAATTGTNTVVVTAAQ